MVRFFKSSMLLLLLLLSFIPSVNAFGAEVTSPYGWRMHPVYNRMIFHAGVDLGVPDKTAVPSVVDASHVAGEVRQAADTAGRAVYRYGKNKNWW